MIKQTNSIEVIGALILGITETFYSSNALTQKESDTLTSKIEPTEWYSVEHIYNIFTFLKKSKRDHPTLMYQAGCAFIQSWYESVGKEMNLGSIGYMKLQDNSAGLKMVMRNYNPDEFFSKVLLMDEKKGIFQAEFASMFPIEFVKGSLYNGLFMWGDLHWLDVNIKQVRSFQYSNKYLADIQFKTKASCKLEEKTLDYVSSLHPNKREPTLYPKMATELAWKTKGLMHNLELQSEINKTTNKILGNALESQFKASLKLKQTNNTKDKLFSIIAHDLKSPINNLSAFLKLLVDDYDEHTEEFRKNVIHELYDSFKQTNTLLSNLLIWANSHLESLDIRPVDFCINELIKENILFTSNMAKKKNIQVKNTATEDLYVNADQEMIKTVIRNLIANAIKFTHRDGLVEVSCTLNKTSVQISIKDNGVGIAPEMLGHILKPNSHITTKGTENEKGTGLGLSICKEFVEKNYGEIWVESELGIGTSFYFTIPTEIAKQTKPLGAKVI